MNNTGHYLPWESCFSWLLGWYIVCVSGKSLDPGTLLYCRGMRHACQICCTIWCHYRRAILKCACILSMCDRCLFCVWFDHESLAVQKRPYISCPVIFVGTAVCICAVLSMERRLVNLLCPVVNHPCRTGGYIMCYVNIMQLCKSSAWDTCLFSVLNVSRKAYWQGGLRWGNLSLHIFLPLFLTIVRNSAMQASRLMLLAFPWYLFSSWLWIIVQGCSCVYHTFFFFFFFLPYLEFA